VFLVHLAAASLLLTTISHTVNWKQNLLAIAEANNWKALQRNYNKTPEEASEKS